MKFKSEEERLKHPQSGKIPHTLWIDSEYFCSEIDDNLHFFLTPLESLLKDPECYLTNNERRCAFLAVLMQPDLNKNLLIEFMGRFRISWENLFQCVFELKDENNLIAILDYIEKELDVNEKEPVLEIDLLCATKYGHHRHDAMDK